MPDPTQKTVLTKKYIWASEKQVQWRPLSKRHFIFVSRTSSDGGVASGLRSNRWRAIIQAFILVFFVLTRTSISKLWYHSRSKTCPQSSVQSCLRKQVQKQMMSLFKTYKSSKPFWPSNWVSIIKVAHFFRKRVRCYKLQELMTMKCLLFVLDSPTSKSCAGLLP